MSAQPPREGLLRAVFPGAELEAPAVGDADTAGTLGTLHGHFAVWDEWIEVRSVLEGHFLERFARGAFTKNFQEGLKRMRCIFRHGLDPHIGQKVLGPVKPGAVAEDAEGAGYALPLYDTQYNRELLPGLKDGQYGSSMEFGIIKQDYKQRPAASEHNPNRIDERTVLEAFVTEFGPCTFPHYQGTTAGIRSITDEIMRERLGPVEGEDAKNSFQVSMSGVPGNGTALDPTSYTLTNTDTAPPALWVPGQLGTRQAPTDHLFKYRRTLERAASAPWAIHPEALATILSIIAERAAGVKASDEEIQARIGARRRETSEESTSGPVATLQVYGPIIPRANLFSDISGGTSIEQLQNQFRQAMADKAVKAIVLEIDSPGGESSLVPEFAAEIRAARSKKKIVAVANVWAASAAYWLASQASELVVTPSGEVGSIGVWSAHEDISGLQEQAGIKTTLVSAGKYKVERNPFEPLSPEAEAEMQSNVDATYNDFLVAVAKGRGVSKDKVLKGYGQGRMVRPAEALKAGMVDRIATLDEVLAELPAGGRRSLEDESLEPDPLEGTTPMYHPEPDPAEDTTRSERAAAHKAWQAQVDAEHRSIRAYANGIPKETS